MEDVCAVGRAACLHGALSSMYRAQVCSDLGDLSVFKLPWGVAPCTEAMLGTWVVKSEPISEIIDVRLAAGFRLYLQFFARVAVR